MLAIHFEFFRVLPVILFFLAVAFAISEKNYGWIVMVVGLLLNGIIWLLISNITMKLYPNLAKRPVNSQCYFYHQQNLTVDNGMPSGHCQSIAFFATWLILMAIYYRVHPVLYIIVVCISTLLVIGMVYSRVQHYKCHNAIQASVGVGIGCITALLCYPILLLLQ